MYLLIITLLILWLALLPLIWLGEKNRPLDEVLGTEHPTDEEFICQLGPDISSDVALKVRRLVADVGGCDIDEIWPDTRLAEVLE